MSKNKIIGIVGGMGPYAGLDLAKKVFDQTLANRDQDHLSVTLLSMPQLIEDRTSYLLGRSSINPAFAIASIILKLERCGATAIGIPCNTAHGAEIFDVVVKELKKAKSSIKLVHMIKEVASFISENYPYIKYVGILSTIGTYKTEIYRENIIKEKYEVIYPDRTFCERVHQAIYDPLYGIKAFSNPATERARNLLIETIEHLYHMGSEAVILGCTEIPLAISEADIDYLPLIDPALVLARALIREVNPNCLKPVPVFKKKNTHSFN